MTNNYFTNIRFIRMFLVILVFFPICSYSQSVSQSPGSYLPIKGKVIDSDGQPLAGASIVEKGTSKGVITAADGTYSIDVRNNNAVLIVSSVGYKSQEVPINENNYSVITLSNEEGDLDDVVVIGYGTTKKKLATGATVQVRGDELQKQSTVSPLTAMQSKSPGVLITTTSGAPGSSYNVNIRGLGTIGDATPLYIIDGIIGVDLNTINPSDIETIDILKDAASSAIYGSRGANGVILITTKQGSAKSPRISYDGYYGIQKVAKYPKVLNAQDYMMLQNESLTNAGISPNDFSALLPQDVWTKIQNGWQGTNWLKEFTNPNARMQNHSVGLTGGTEQSIYALSGTYTKQAGIFGQPTVPTYDRYSVRMNSSYNILKGEGYNKVKIGENLMYIVQKRDANWMGTIRNFMTAMPLMPVYDSDGNFFKTTSLDPDRVNPIGDNYYNGSFSKSTNYDLKANAYLEFKPVKELLFRSSFGYYLFASAGHSFIPKYDLGDKFKRTEDLTSQGHTMFSGYQWENTLAYNFSLNSNHQFSALIGQSIEKGGLGSYINGSNVNSLFNDFEHAYLSNTPLVVSGKTQINGGPTGINSIASFFGRLNYDFRETYLFSASLRADGSSKFARGKRWGYFPAISAGWVLTNEKFLEDIKGINFFKLRGSWGQNGSQSIPPFQYLSQYTFGNNYFFGIDKTVWTTGAYPARLPNPDVSWEGSEQTNLGFDSRFLNSRLSVVFDIYRKATKNWLVEAPVLGSYGAAPPYINGGDVVNDGIELGVDWNESKGDFKYSISGNISYNKNKITRIANTQGIIQGSHVSFADGIPPIYRAQVGYPIGYFYGYKTNGVFQNQAEIDNYKGAKLNNVSPGDLIFVDVNKDGIIDENDKTNIGNPNPKYYYGLSGNISYKMFDFSVTTYGFADYMIASSFHLVNHYQENYPVKMLERWHGEGTSNRYPKIASNSSPNYMYFSDIYLDKGTFWRIQNVTLGYDFKKLIKKNYPNQFRVYISVQNLYTFTNYYGADPEIANASDNWGRGVDIGIYPTPRTFLIGVNLGM